MHEFRSAIFAIRSHLSGIRYNIGVYEGPYGRSIDPLSQMRTLSDLRESEKELLDAIAILESKKDQR